jgi:hypothetical protein
MERRKSLRHVPQFHALGQEGCVEIQRSDFDEVTTLFVHEHFTIIPHTQAK